MKHFGYSLQHNRVRIDVPYDLLQAAEAEPGFTESLEWLSEEQKLLVPHSLQRNPHFVINTSEYQAAEAGAEAAAEMTVRVVDSWEQLASSVGREDPKLKANFDTTSTMNGERILQPKTEIMVPEDVSPQDLGRITTKSMVKAAETMGYRDLADAREVVHATVSPAIGLHLTVHDREGRFVKAGPVDPETGVSVVVESRLRSHQEQVIFFFGGVAIVGAANEG